MRGGGGGVNETSLEAFIRPPNAAVQSVKYILSTAAATGRLYIIQNYPYMLIIADHCELAARTTLSIYIILHIASRFCHINIPAGEKTKLHFFPFPIISSAPSLLYLYCYDYIFFI